MSKKLIKKNQLGGIAEAVDKSLDGLGTWGKLGVQMVDPTGITGWKDFGDSLKAFLKEGTLLKAGELGLSTLGVVPMVGVFKSAGKALGKLGKMGKAEKASTTAGKAVKMFDKDTYKALVDSTEPVAYWMARNFTPEMKAEASRILDGEIVKIVDWCKSKNIKKVPKKLEDKIAILAEKQSTIMGNNLDIPRFIDNINLELNGL